MLKPITCQSDNPSAYQEGYQQALADFGVTDLLSQLSNYSGADENTLNEQEIESLAALFVQQVTANLTSNLIAGHLDAMRHGSVDVLSKLSRSLFPPASSDLPSIFPNVKMPCFWYGEKLRWISEGDKTDWGIVLGRFYSFASHLGAWSWCYLIWLDKDSPSAAWCAADIAWEHDLAPYPLEHKLHDQ